MILDKDSIILLLVFIPSATSRSFITRIFEKNEILSYLAMSLNLSCDIFVSYSLRKRDSLSITDKENERGKIEWILMRM